MEATKFQPIRQRLTSNIPSAAPHQQYAWACRVSSQPSTSGRADQQTACLSQTRPSLRRQTILRCTPRYNPQNVDQPVVVPSASLSALESVIVQLKALQHNDEPWDNHGLQTCYEFAEDAGGMEMSEYFGFRKDLYHFDHFMGLFGGRLGRLISLQGYEVLDPPDGTAGGVAPAGPVVVRARVVDGKGDDAGVFVFRQVRRQIGSKKGFWMTKSLVREDSSG